MMIFFGAITKSYSHIWCQCFVASFVFFSALEMDEGGNEVESLTSRVEQLQRGISFTPFIFHTISVIYLTLLLFNYFLIW